MYNDSQKNIINYKDNFIFVEIDKIPDTLKHKKIYKLIKENFKYMNNTTIPFPIDIYKKELIITSLIYLIYTIEIVYNIKNVIPLMNYEFAIFYKDIILNNLDYLKYMYPNSIYLKEIEALLKSKTLDELYDYIADNNYKNLLLYVIHKKNNILFL